MDLIQLKSYLRGRKITPIQDVAFHFQTDIETVRPMLTIWINKGKLRKSTDIARACKGCCTCDLAAIEIYEWID